MASYVLIHGEYTGGWVWQEVAALLRDEGHDVHTPSLTGMGDRSHLLHKDVGLSVHIADIANYITSYDLRDVTLVSHGYGGLVACGVVEHRAKRVASLVFVDAVLGRDGMSWLDLADAGMREDVFQLARQEGEGWRLPPLTPAAMGVMCSSDIERTAPRLCPMPFKVLGDPLSLPKMEYLKKSCAYLACINPVLNSMMATSAREAKAHHWQFYEMLTSHMAMINTPEEILRILTFL